MTSYKDRARDEAIVDEVNVDRALRCPAAGCPNRWSVEGDRGRGCSAHYWADPRDWPRITQEFLEAETRRALYAAASRPVPDAVPATPPRQAAIIALRAFAAWIRSPAQRGDGRDWARALQCSDQSGERLTRFQVNAYRQALRLEAAVSDKVVAD
jgi:hypothetical protein